MGPYDLDSALKDFNKKFREKTGLGWTNRHATPKSGKYTFLEKIYDESDDEAKPQSSKVKDEANSNGIGPSKEASTSEAVPCSLHPSLQSLMQLIFNEKHFDAVLDKMGYNSDKLPLGKLSKAVMSKGYGLLSQLSLVLTEPGHAAAKLGVSQLEVRLLPRLLQHSC